MKFSYSTGNLIFFGFLIILLILPIFDRHKIGKFQTQKSLLGIRLWVITYPPMERTRCLPQINAIKFFNLVPRVLSYPLYGARERVGENPGNEVENFGGILERKFLSAKQKWPLRSKHSILSRHSKAVKSIKMLYWPDFSKALCYRVILIKLDFLVFLLPNYFTYN